MTSRSNLLTVREVADWIGVSQSAIYKWVADDRFPLPIKLGGEKQKRVAVRWLEEDIQQWIQERKHAPDPE